MKKKHIADCYKYTLQRLEELSASYEEQKDNTEDFALWNLPNELAEDWCNMEYFIGVLYSNNCINGIVKSILCDINNNFLKYSKGEPNYEIEIWTHEGLKKSNFWEMQRTLARKALQLMKGVL